MAKLRNLVLGGLEFGNHCSEGSVSQIWEFTSSFPTAASSKCIQTILKQSDHSSTAHAWGTLLKILKVSKYLLNIANQTAPSKIGDSSARAHTQNLEISQLSCQLWSALPRLLILWIYPRPRGYDQQFLFLWKCSLFRKTQEFKIKLFCCFLSGQWMQSKSLPLILSCFIFQARRIYFIYLFFWSLPILLILSSPLSQLCRDPSPH